MILIIFSCFLNFFLKLFFFPRQLKFQQVDPSRVHAHARTHTRSLYQLYCRKSDHIDATPHAAGGHTNTHSKCGQKKDRKKYTIKKHHKCACTHKRHIRARPGLLRTTLKSSTELDTHHLTQELIQQ